MKKVDMSAKAVAARLKRVSQLRRLCLSLGKSTLNQKGISQRVKEKKRKENVNNP